MHLGAFRFDRGRNSMTPAHAMRSSTPMTEHLVVHRRILLAAAGTVALLIGVGSMAAGFVLSVMWPGIAWGLGSAVALVAFVGAGELLATAVTGRRRRPGARNA